MEGIILAAGVGKRLRPLTDAIPKCLISVNGKPILEQQLESLVAAGIQNCTIVIGYRGDQVQSKYQYHYNGIDIRYVVNPLFDSTNNLYSLWLGIQQIESDVITLESDVFFEHALLKDFLTNPHPNGAILAVHHPGMDGTVARVHSGLVRQLILKSEQGEGFNYANTLKTVNIYKFASQTIQESISPWLDQYVAQGKCNEFYESVIASLVDTNQLVMSAHSTGNHLWAEIDTVEDLEEAQRTFPPSIGRDT